MCDPPSGSDLHSRGVGSSAGSHRLGFCAEGTIDISPSSLLDGGDLELRRVATNLGLMQITPFGGWKMGFSEKLLGFRGGAWLESPQRIATIMQAFPHHYHTSASATPESNIPLESSGKPTLVTGPPVEFGGTGKEWSPEDLLVGAVVDCYILSFKALAKAAHMEWRSISCRATGTLDKVDRLPQFTAFEISARLEILDVADREKAERLLHKAEDICLVTNSLKAGSSLVVEIVTS